MMKKFALFVILISFFQTTLAQNLQGKVVDETTGTGIPFVSIGILGTNLATVTNDNGDFILTAPTYPIKLRASHISYLPVEISLSENPKNLIIKISPATLSLNIVTIDPFVGQRIIKAALEKAKSNVGKSFYANAFYRQLTTLNNNPSQIYELFYDLHWNTKRIQGWQAKQSRFAELNEGITFSLNNQSYFTFSYSGYLMPDKGGKFINLNNLSDFTITIEKYIEQADQKIAVVSCKYKNAKRKQYYVNSTYYIGVDDANVYRLENSVYNLPITLADATAKYPPVVSTVATFNKNGQEITVLESVSTKFELNTIIKGGQNLNSSISSLLTIYKLDQSLKDEQFEALNKKTKDKNVIESIAYNPLFWKNNPIVKQTTLEDTFIKMMESKKAFGTMTSP